MFLFIVQYLPISRIKNLLRQVNKSHCERIESILEQQQQKNTTLLIRISSYV